MLKQGNDPSGNDPSGNDPSGNDPSPPQSLDCRSAGVAGGLFCDLRIIVSVWGLALLAFGASWPPAIASEISAREVTSRLFKASPGTPTKFVDMDLSFLDLAGIDFKSADLTGADLYGTNLTDAVLIGCNLSEVRFDRATIVRANFSEANLEDATFLRPSMFATLDFSPRDRARFTHAKMRRVRMIGHFNGVDFRGADLREASFAPLRRKPDTIATLARTRFTGADLTGVNAEGANFTETIMEFARLKGANLKGALFYRADLSRADLSGADVTGADFTEAELDGANLSGVTGLETAKGLSVALGAAVQGTAQP